MGCAEVRQKNAPILLFEFDEFIEQQKNYCLKFKDKYDYIYTIRYQIQSNIYSKFSIKLKIKDSIFDIQTEFSDSEEDLQKALKDIYDKLDTFYNFRIKEKEIEEGSIFINKEEKDRLKEIKQEMLENRQKLKEEKIFEKLEKKEEDIKNEKNEKINKILEDMCIYGNITKKEIKEEKKKNPEKYIETSEALKSENEDQALFALGLISQNLENLGIETAIDKSVEDTVDEGLTALECISNGMIGKKNMICILNLEKKEMKNY